MSRKNKAYRAWHYQNPDGTPKDAWDAAWANQQGCFASLKHNDQQARIEYLIKWVQHDCPYSREEILETMERELEGKP